MDLRELSTIGINVNALRGNVFSKFGTRKPKYGVKSGCMSRLEMAVNQYLLLRQKNGEIKDLKKQVNIHLTKARILYIPDFEFFDLKQNKTVWAEAKGIETPSWRIKRRLWKAGYGPGNLEIYMGSYKSFKLIETLESDGSLYNEGSKLKAVG